MLSSQIFRVDSTHKGAGVRNRTIELGAREVHVRVLTLEALQHQFLLILFFFNRVVDGMSFECRRPRGTHLYLGKGDDQLAVLWVNTTRIIEQERK